MSDASTQGGVEILRAVDIAKRYGGVVALQGADITLRRGEIHALVGENGAGKSTLVKILCGVIRPDRGTLQVDGQPVTFNNHRDAVAHGIAIVSQELSLFPDVSVAENLLPLALPRRFGLVSHREVQQLAEPLLREFDLDLDFSAPVGSLALVDQQQLEICRALLQQPKVLVLDEPTSAQPREAVARLERTLNSLVSRGLAVLYISHILEEVMRLSQRVSVMRDGRIALAEAKTADVDLRTLVGAMLGEAIGQTVSKASGAAKETSAPAAPTTAGSGGPADDTGAGIRIDDLVVPGRLHGVSLSAHPHEVIGLAGLQGSGHAAVLEAVCGRVRPTSGDVVLPDGAQPKSLRHAIEHGVAFVPGDRKRLGLMLDKTALENISSVSWLGLNRDGYFERRKHWTTRALDQFKRLRVRGHIWSTVSELSGGNQQKVVFAKWLEVDPTVVALDDPTRGVDVGARAEMHAVIRDFAASGKVVLVASSDLAELVSVCDRVVVFQHGRIVGELSGPQLSERALSITMNAGFAESR